MSAGGELSLPPELAAEMADIYAALQADYERVAGLIGLTCADCPDNCCDSYFLHYTWCEWAFLWEGLRRLDAESLADIRERARQYREAQIGQTVDVLVEETDGEGVSHGYTAQYMACGVRGGVPGEICRVLVTGTDDDGLTGEKRS